MGLKDWVIQKVLVGYLKSWLDALPFNGWKSALGILLVILGEMLKVMPQYSGPLSVVIDILRALPSDPVTDMGILALIVGAVHKLLKALKLEQ
jgi:hypothetical protein